MFHSFQFLKKGFLVNLIQCMTLYTVTILRFYLYTMFQVDVGNKFDVCRQCFSALAFLHRVWIIHQDIKPSNMLVIITIHYIDFNMTHRETFVGHISKQLMEQRTGTNAYIQAVRGQCLACAHCVLHPLPVHAYEWYKQ